MSKLAAGHLDLHSGRSQVDLAGLAELARARGADAALVERIAAGNTALDALMISQDAGFALGDAVAAAARLAALDILRGAPIEVDIVVIDRAGTIVGRA
jgi:cobalt-precorrin-5B (C1)-methyltransferase